VTELFDNTRTYQPTDAKIITLLGSTENQAQMRHHGRLPAYYRLGRKIIYHGSDLNAWASAQRISHGDAA